MFLIKIKYPLSSLILVPEWAKNQIADQTNEDDNRPKRGGGGGFGYNRRGRGGRANNDEGEETRPSKEVTLFDFLETKPKCNSFD